MYQIRKLYLIYYIADFWPIPANTLLNEYSIHLISLHPSQTHHNPSSGQVELDGLSVVMTLMHFNKAISQTVETIQLNCAQASKKCWFMSVCIYN